MIQGLIHKIQLEKKTEFQIILTGGNSKYFKRCFENVINIDEFFNSKGLNYLTNTYFKKTMNYTKNDLLYLPLGGSGEIGMNCNLYHYEDKWIMIDLGVTFSDNDSNNYDLIMPNIDFILERVNKLSALILTHAHEDHIGAVPYLIKNLKNVPIYATSFTASVLKRKFLSVGLADYKINIMEYGKEIRIDDFILEIYCMTHSIPESNAVMIKTKQGNILHSGDWKLDPSPLIGKPLDKKALKNL